MAMSPRNFSRLFRGETGETPAQFTERARAAPARSKLEHTVVPVETIAEGVRGFGDISAPFRGQSARLAGAVSINSLQLTRR
jgi:transcriptional regulator GlxA family with amidase domain